MSNTTINSGETLSISVPGATGSVIDFSGTSAVLTLATSQLSTPFNIVTVNNNGTISVVSDSIGATIMNFAPASFGTGADTIVVEQMQTLFAALDFSAADLQDFIGFGYSAAQERGEYIIAPDGSIANTPFTHTTLDNTIAPVLDTIVSGIFGTLAAVSGSNLLMQFITVTNPKSNNPFIEALITTSDNVVNPCFAAGTRILTPRGEVPVEDLAAGDCVITHDGAEQKIIWLGTRRVDITRHPRPETVRPVVIEADALADGVPARRLRLSPDHAVYLDHQLVPAKMLINGTTIRADTVTAVTYYHIELAAHGILFAEQAPAESFLDCGHRGAFDNAGEPVMLHPALMQTRRENSSCAPLCLEGAALAAIRARLAARRHRMYGT
jgi:hypothetical protein